MAGKARSATLDSVTKTFAGLIGCVLLAACNGAVVTTGERGAEPGSGGGGRAASGGFGSQGGGPAQGGAFPTGPEPGPVLPAGSAPVVEVFADVTRFRNSRPHSLDTSAGHQGFVVIPGQSLTERAGDLFGDATIVQSYAVPPSETAIYFSQAAPVGGLRKRGLVPGDRWSLASEEIIVDDGAVADALVVWRGFALRKRVAESGRTVFERVDFASKTVERLGPEAAGADREPGRLALEGASSLESATFYWSVETGGEDAGVYRANAATGGATLIAPGPSGDLRVFRSSVLHVRPGVSADGGATRTLESIGPNGSPRKALFTIQAVAMTIPTNVDDRLYFGAQLAPGEATKLLRAPSGGGAPRIVLAQLCAPDPWLPSLYEDAAYVYAACPASGDFLRITPLD